MNGSVLRSLGIRGLPFEAQLLRAADRLWVRVTDNDTIVRYWSGLEVLGAVPPDEVLTTVVWAITARRPHVVLDHLRFPGWEYWPGRPNPIGAYLDSEFATQLAQVKQELLDDH